MAEKSHFPLKKLARSWCDATSHVPACHKLVSADTTLNFRKLYFFVFFCLFCLYLSFFVQKKPRIIGQTDKKMVGTPPPRNESPPLVPSAFALHDPTVLILMTIRRFSRCKTKILRFELSTVKKSNSINVMIRGN